MNLEQTAASLLEQYPTESRAHLQKQERLIERFGQIAFGGFGLMVILGIIGLIYTVITKMVLTGSNFWAGILLAAFMVFAALTLSYVVLRESVKDKRAKLNSSSRELAPAAPETGRLLEESHFEPAGSITEHTTQHLSAEKISKTQKR